MAASSTQRAHAKKSRIHGTGLFASGPIKSGERIIQYTGERVTKREAERRYVDQRARGTVYLFELNSRYDLDGDIVGNDAKYANHSCDANSETEVTKGEIWIVARRDIAKGDEITFDYNFPSLDWEDRPCRCGTDKCRQYIVGVDSYRYLKRKWKKDAERQAIIDARGNTPLAIVKRSGVHGKGLFANVDILKGEQIVQYSGERIDKDEALLRYEEQAAQGHIFLFELDDDWDIDGSHPDNMARWANHSCAPNAETEVVDDEIWVSALRNISKGEEVMYDYNLPLHDYKKRPCDCGASTCRRYIMGKDAERSLKRKRKHAAAKRAQAAGSKKPRRATKGTEAAGPGTKRKAGKGSR